MGFKDDLERVLSDTGLGPFPEPPGSINNSSLQAVAKEVYDRFGLDYDRVLGGDSVVLAVFPLKSTQPTRVTRPTWNWGGCYPLFSLQHGRMPWPGQTQARSLGKTGLQEVLTCPIDLNEECQLILLPAP